MEKLENLKGVYFEWNEAYKKLGRAVPGRHIGLIAQEVQQQFPEIVSVWGDDSDYLAIDYSRFSVVLLEGIKELYQQTKAQQKEIEEMKLQLNSLGQIGSEPTDDSQNFVGKIKQALTFLGFFLENDIAKIKEIITEKLSAEVIVSKKIETERMITKEIQMVDKVTGKVYCLWIENGELMKIEGECESMNNE